MIKKFTSALIVDNSKESEISNYSRESEIAKFIEGLEKYVVDVEVTTGEQSEDALLITFNDRSKEYHPLNGDTPYTPTSTNS